VSFDPVTVGRCTRIAAGGVLWRGGPVSAALLVAIVVPGEGQRGGAERGTDPIGR
jgi:hypothetical protein